MAKENVKNLQKFFAKQMDSIDFVGETSIEDFWKWYCQHDVRLLLPPYINAHKKIVNAIFIPLQGVRRRVFRGKNMEKVREKVEKWQKDKCGKKSCVHDEWYASFCCSFSTEERVHVATIFYS